MSEAKHTPGPWSFRGDMVPAVNHPEPMIADFRIYSTDGHFICHMSIMNDQTRANARLIASAPDMLKALEFEEKWRKEQDAATSEHYRIQASFLRTFAITKAKGEDDA